MNELTGDSCAIPTHVWASVEGSLQFPGSSHAEETAAELCSPGRSRCGGTQTCRKWEHKLTCITSSYVSSTLTQDSLSSSHGLSRFSSINLSFQKVFSFSAQITEESLGQLPGLCPSSPSLRCQIQAGRGPTQILPGMMLLLKSDISSYLHVSANGFSDSLGYF